MIHHSNLHSNHSQRRFLNSSCHSILAYFFSFKYDKDIPRNNPPIMLPKVTGNKLFNNISFIVIVLSNKYPNDR